MSDEACLHGLIEAQASKTPDSIALAFEGKTLTYRELDRRANGLAHRLRRMGLGPEMPVGLCVERSLDMVVAILGILKAGAAYLPIDPGYPAERIAFMLADAKAKVVLTHGRLLNGVGAGDSAAQIFPLDAESWGDEDMPPAVEVSGINLAYVIYTSGSTGQPKGVCVEHRNIVNYVRGIVERLDLVPGLNHAMVSTVAADLGNTVLFPSLATGGCLHLMSRQRTENQGLLAEYFQREHIDVLKIVPSHLAALQGAKNPERVMPASRLILGGEASQLAWVAQLRTLAPNCRIFNHYGPTETTVGVLTYAVGPELPQTRSGTLPLGRPLPGTTVHVLDAGGHPVAPGEVGELYIGGAGVARGYLNRPELTAAKFVPDTIGREPGARLYRSGDLVRCLPDGSLEFCGRVDDQVKLHGYRVELGEIESAMRAHEGVQAAAVRLFDGEQLVAYVAPKRPDQPLWNARDVHILPDGTPVAHLNRNETDYIYHEIFVLQAYFRHGIELRDGDCIVDAGANIGLFTVFANRIAHKLRVFACEPNPAAFACLAANAQAWGTNVTCLPLGLSSENKSAELTFFEGLSLLSGFYADPANEHSVVRNYVLNQQHGQPGDERFEAEVAALIDERLKARTVPASLHTLSDVMARQRIERVDLLKVNVEKSELDVLRGIADADWPKIRQLVIEVDLNANLAPIVELLETRGYDVAVDQDPLLDRTELYYVYAKRAEAGKPLIVGQADGAHARALPPPDAGVLTPGSLRRHLAERLPAHMVPSAFVLLDKLPLNANGKIDRQALPRPAEPVAMPSAAEPVSPRTEIERTLSAIFTKLLKIEHIGIHDDFFDLGGQSLLAIQAVSRIRDALEVDLPARALFENPTIAKLAALLGGSDAADAGVPRIGRRKPSARCELSFAQEQLWFLHQIAPDSPAYNIVDVIELEGSYDRAALARALRELVRRHEALRTAFVLADGRPMQSVLPTLELGVAETDLRGLPGDEQARLWSATVAKESRAGFDLSQPPLLRAAVAHFSENEHRLLLCVHHIVADEWSMEILQRELRQIYAAYRDGAPSPLRELPLQYADFASWQRERMDAAALQPQAAFWRQELASAPTTLELPVDKRRPATQSFRGTCEAFALPPGLLAQAKALGKQEQATLFMVLEAGFAALLQRYTGQDDILVGTPISGRTLSETEGLIGCFLNTIVLRSRFSAGMTFRELLAQTRRRALDAYAHADLPFERLVAELAPRRDPGRTPLFQAMFVLHNAGGASRVAQVDRARELETGTSKFDLTLFFSERGDGLDGLIEYSTDLFEAATIRRICAHYTNLLDAALREPDRGLTQLTMLSPAERRRVLEDYNATATEFDARDRCVHELVEAQAQRTPQRVAVMFAERHMTYAELDQRATQLANYLRAKGLKPGALAGVLVERSLGMLVSLLGILKAGGAYVPLDPAYPSERLAHMVEDSRMQMMITHRDLDQLLPRRPATVVRLDADADEIAFAGSPAMPLPPADPARLAYVLYTSGSTGKPKGVAIEHAALTNFLLSMRNQPGIAEADTLLAVTTLSFDIAGLELYLPLIAGARLVIAGRDEAADPERLAARLSTTPCTLMQATPATWRALLHAGWEGSSDLKILCGGEAMPADLAAALLPRCRELWNMYGPTETTIWSAAGRIEAQDAAAASLPVGRPIANTQVYVLDGGGNPVPAGMMGEIWIAGRGLARGYLYREELTRERFVDCPFMPGSRMYRTGDLGRWLPDGRLVCLGRTDHQLKVRGFRIEAGEVESAIASHPDVRESVVVARADSHGDGMLTAYVATAVAGEGQAQLAEQLRASLRQRLPEYMLPSRFVFLPALPHTDNGKIDRKALPAPAAAAAVRTSFVAARSPTETAVLAAFRDVIGRSDFGVTDNFFELGGHSLMAARLMTRLREAYGISMPLRHLFEQPTPAGLARVVDELSWLAADAAKTAATGQREEIAL